MSGRDRDGSFADAMRELGDEVRELEDREERVAPASAPPERTDRDASGEPVRFHFPDPDEPLLGYAEGIAAAQLRRLRRGDLPAERSIDLHGLRGAEARRRLHAELEAAAREGLRCVLVVHGRGHRSKAEPVLRTGLPTWLAEPPVGRQVLAFAPSGDRAGGATLVLLRRRR